MTSTRIDLAVLGVDGISVSVRTATTIEITWFSDETSARLDDDQFTAGEGPVFDAITGLQPILCPSVAATVRWPGFTACALRLGAHAVFAFPMLLGPVCIGAIMCHRRQHGPMSDKQLAAAMTLTDRLRPETLLWNAAGDEQGGPALRWAEVHQAAGILHERLGIPVDEALARLRAHAFSHQRAIIELARDVITGHLHLPQDIT